MPYIKKIFSILNSRQKKILLIISFISLILMLLEIIGLSLVYPLVTVVIDPVKFKDLISSYNTLDFLNELQTNNLIFYIIIGIGLFYFAKILIQIFGNYLKKHGFTFKERQRGNQIWINYNYFRKHLFNS